MFSCEQRRALRPVLWRASAAGLAGLLSFFALGGPHGSARTRAAYVPAASAPASDAWNLPKRI